MEKELILQWEQNKAIIKEWFEGIVNKDEEVNSYLDIVKFLFSNVLKPHDDYYENFDANKIKLVDDGDYQGTQLFVIPIKKYQPDSNDYYVTTVNYGSCSGCDTLQGIYSYGFNKNYTQMVDDLMSLALHLVQKTKRIYD